MLITTERKIYRKYFFQVSNQCFLNQKIKIKNKFIKVSRYLNQNYHFFVRIISRFIVHTNIANPSLTIWRSEYRGLTVNKLNAIFTFSIYYHVRTKQFQFKICFDINNNSAKRTIQILENNIINSTCLGHSIGHDDQNIVNSRIQIAIRMIRAETF